MSGVIALVGRPNVGKSTLFNALTQSRDALVADLPGLTRDRRYGLARLETPPAGAGQDGVVIDTGGLSLEVLTAEGLNPAPDALVQAIIQQTAHALEEADVILLLVDARDGLLPDDEAIARTLRRYAKPVVLAVNKIDGVDKAQAHAEFARLGFADIYFIAAKRAIGLAKLKVRLCELISPLAVVQPPAVAQPPDPDGDTVRDDALEGPAAPIRVAFIGRPNVGKSTLVNRLLGETRLTVADQPGTTRDSITVPFTHNGLPYLLIDTAGIRRRARVREAVEKFSVIKSLEAVQAAHVVVLMIDAREGVTEQDATLAGLVLEAGRALVLALNKWDGLSPEHKAQVRRELDFRLSFVNFVEIQFISALHGSGVGLLMQAVSRAWQAATVDVPTAELTRLLEQAVTRNPPPMIHRRRIKLRYAHQGGVSPPLFVIHGNQTAHLPTAYRRYLVNFFREQLRLTGTPVRLEFKTGENPYAGRRNTLTPSQQRHRKRLVRHAKSH